MALLVGAALTLQSLSNLSHVNLGFRPDHVLTMSLDSETMAHRYWPGADPIGKRLRVPFLAKPNEPPPLLTFVGIAGDARLTGLADPPDAEVYVPFLQYPRRFAMIAIRTESEPRKFAPLVQREVWSLDKNQPIGDVSTMEEAVTNSIWPLRLATTILTLFGAVGLVMAMSGLYAVMAHSVRQRTKEIGVRMAIGSRAAAVVRLVAGEGLRLAVVGISTGLVCAVLLNGLGAAWLTGASTADTVNRWLPPGQRQFLFGLNALDPLTFATVAAILTLVAFAASYFPARQASRADPIAALRTE